MSGGTHPIAILQKVLDDACGLGVFPSAQAVVLHRGVQVFGGVAGNVSGDTRFDLASLTKVISTTSLFLRLWTEGKVGPETLVSRYFPGTPVGDAGVTVADLLYHRSGLPPFVPFFAQALTAHPSCRTRTVPPLCAPASEKRSSRPPPLRRSPPSRARSPPTATWASSSWVKSSRGPQALRWTRSSPATSPSPWASVPASTASPTSPWTPCPRPPGPLARASPLRVRRRCGGRAHPAHAPGRGG